MMSAVERWARQRLRSLAGAASNDEEHEWVWSSDTEHWLVSSEWAAFSLPSVQAAFALSAHKLYVAAAVEGAVGTGWRISHGDTHLRVTSKSVWPVLRGSYSDEFTFWMPGGAETNWKPVAERRVFVSKPHQWNPELNDRLVELPWDYLMYDEALLDPEARARRLLEFHRDSETCVLMIDTVSEMFSRVNVWEFETANIDVPSAIVVGDDEIILRDPVDEPSMVLKSYETADSRVDWTAYLPLKRMRHLGAWTLEDR